MNSKVCLALNISITISILPFILPSSKISCVIGLILATPPSSSVLFNDRYIILFRYLFDSFDCEFGYLRDEF